MDNQLTLNAEEIDIINSNYVNLPLPPSIPDSDVANIRHLYTILNLFVYYNHLFHNKIISYVALTQLKNLKAYYTLNLSDIDGLIHAAEDILEES